MITVPHDTTDILLAPVALDLDQQLDQLGALDQAEIHFLVALTTDREPNSLDRRRELLLASLVRDVDTHGWDVAWHARGLRLEHGGRQVVLGLPASVRLFVGQS